MAKSATPSPPFCIPTPLLQRLDSSSLEFSYAAQTFSGGPEGCKPDDLLWIGKAHDFFSITEDVLTIDHRLGTTVDYQNYRGTYRLGRLGHLVDLLLKTTTSTTNRLLTQQKSIT